MSGKFEAVISMKYTNTKILVIGAGISGIGAARALAKAGANVILSDVKDLSAEKTAALTALGIECVFGAQKSSLLAGVEQIIMSPGIAPTIPLAVAATEAGIPVVSEIEVAYELSQAPIYAITGTNGKTTTTTLLGDMVAAGGLKNVVGGNIGKALSEQVSELSPDGIVVAEVSSFQLEMIDRFRPHVAAVLNITPDHFERHGDMDSYVQAKARIFENQTTDDVLILNAQDPYCRAFAEKAQSRILWVSTAGKVENGAYVENDVLYLNANGVPEVLLSADELLLKGEYNWLNILTASLMAQHAGVPLSVIRGVLRVFKGLPHRVENVATQEGINYYNDSKATNTDATIKALQSFSQPLVWIAGGYDKGTDLTLLMQVARKCKGIVFLGNSKERFSIAAQKEGISNIELAGDLAQAVKKAQKLAQKNNATVVLFSPAASSYDQYHNYQERGRDFCRLVAELEN